MSEAISVVQVGNFSGVSSVNGLYGVITFANASVSGQTITISGGGGGGVSDGDTLATGLTFPNTGLHILDTNASHDLIITPGSNITADRTLTITTGDADRTLTLSGNVTFSNSLTFAGTNGSTLNIGGGGTLGTGAYATISDYLTTASAASTYQPLDADLTAIAALSGTDNIYYRSGANTWTSVTIGTGLTFSGGSLSVTGSTYQPLDADLTSWASVTRASGFDTFAATPSTTNFFSLLTGETGPWKGLATATSLGAISFVRVNADDTVTLQNLASFLTELGLDSTDSVSFDYLNAESGLSAGAGGFDVDASGDVICQTLVAALTNSILVGTAGTAVGTIGFRNATSGTATVAPPTGALGTYTVTLPNAASTLPIFGQQITFAGPTAARTITLPDANFTVARSTLAGSPCEIGIACSDETTALTTGTAKATFRMPYAMTLTAVRASVTTAPTGTGNLTIDINESGTTVLSTKLTFDASEKTTTTAATPAVISDSALADDAEITIDIDAVSGTVTGAGLKVWLIGTRA